MDAMPFIYDAPRVQRIIKPDGETNHVIVHTGRPNAADSLKNDAVKEVYDLSVGTYDVTIDVGPSYQTKRQEAFANQMQLAAADKTGEVMKVAGDIIIGNSDMPGAREIAARIKKLVPPQVLDDDGTDPKVQLQQATARLTQAQQINQELMKHNQEMMTTIQTKSVEAQNKLDIVKIQTAAQVEVAALNAKLDAAKLDFQKWELLHTTAHEAGLQADQQEHEAGLQSDQQEHEADQATQQQEHESDQQEAQAAQEAPQQEAQTTQGQPQSQGD
jgi:hypothetical protein